MPTIIITITQSINDAIARTYGYQAMIPDGKGGTISNPVTPDQFTQNQIEQFIANILQADMYNQAQITARATVDTSLAKTPVAIQTTLQ